MSGELTPEQASAFRQLFQTAKRLRDLSQDPRADTGLRFKARAALFAAVGEVEQLVPPDRGPLAGEPPPVREQPAAEPAPTPPPRLWWLDRD